MLITQALTLTSVLGFAVSAWGAPGSRTSAEWQRYANQAEQRIERNRLQPTPMAPTDDGKLRSGEILVERFQSPDISGGLIHHWAGTAFIPGVTLDEVQAITADIGAFPRHYAPEVISARVLSRSPRNTRLLMRLRKEYIATVVLEAEYDVQTETVDPSHHYSSSRSVRIQEVRDFGKPSESLTPTGEDHGFLWAMNSYWSYTQVSGGVYVRCETLSLSRDIPLGMGWLLGPVVNRLPRESLRRTLQATRTAVLSSQAVSISTQLEKTQ